MNLKKKDQDAIAALYLETLDRSSEYDWSNPYKGDIRKLKQHETGVDVGSERGVGKLSGEFSVDPRDYPNQYDDDITDEQPTTEELLNNPTMIKIFDKLRNDRSFAFSPTDLGDMDPPNTWTDRDMLEILEYAFFGTDGYDMMRNPKQNAMEIYQAIKNHFIKYIAKYR